MTRTFAVVLRAAALVAAASSPSTAYAQSPPFHPPVARDLAAELACAPNAAETAPVQALRVTGGQVAGKKSLRQRRDGARRRRHRAPGIETGQDYFVRRVVSDPFNAHYPDGATHHQIHTAGWIHIAEVACGRCRGDGHARLRRSDGGRLPRALRAANGPRTRCAPVRPI